MYVYKFNKSHQIHHVALLFRKSYVSTGGNPCLPGFQANRHWRDHPFLLSSLDVRFGARLFQLLLCVLPKRLLFFFPGVPIAGCHGGFNVCQFLLGCCWILLDVSLSFRYHDDLDICDKSGQRFDEWIIDPNNLQLYRKMRQEQFCQRSHAIATWLRKKEHTCFGLLVLVDLEASTKHLQGRPMAMQDSVAAIPNLEPLTNDAQA